MPVTPQTAHVITPEELAYYTETAHEWIADNQKLHSWLEVEAFIMLQILKKVAQTPPPGRSGNTVQVSAIRDFFTQAEKVLDMVASKRAAPAVRPEGAADREGP
jgi:hypothetical protein